jgi:hypothetical protein
VLLVVFIVLFIQRRRRGHREDSENILKNSNSVRMSIFNSVKILKDITIMEVFIF